MQGSLRNKTLRGAAWSFFEKIGTQVVHFLVTIVLARLLTPSDYGVIGLLIVFLGVSQLFIDCGFGWALIRTKNRSEADLSTVFWYNLVISVVCYVALFLTAPCVASFYNMPSLKSILRVLGLNLIIQALYAIQVTRLTALVNFGLQARIVVSASIVSGIIGISLAYCGMGAWALVVQMMSATAFSCVMFWSFSGWRPKMLFSYASFRRLFGFGSKIMLASSLHTIYTSISPLIIGRKYSAADLGVYSRSDSLVALPGGIFQSTLGRVIFPVLSSIQEDEIRLRMVYNKYLRIVTSVVAPSMLLMAAVSEPVILTLIGAKWLSCVPYIMILAIAWMVDPIIIVNLNILYVKGRSDIVLKLEIIKKIIAIAIVVVSVQFGILWLCIGRVVYSFIALGLNLHVCGPFIGMSFWQQMQEVWRIYVCGSLAAICAYAVVQFSGFSNDGVWWHQCACLITAGLTGFLIYSSCAIWLKFDIVAEVLDVLGKAKGSLCKQYF